MCEFQRVLDVVESVSGQRNRQSPAAVRDTSSHSCFELCFFEVGYDRLIESPFSFGPRHTRKISDRPIVQKYLRTDDTF